MKDARRGEIAAGAPLSVLLVTNMWPSQANPKFGSFVRDAERSMADAGVATRVVAITDPRTGAARVAIKYAGLTVRSIGAGIRGGFDAVHAHYLYPTGAAAMRAARMGDVPLVVYSHGSDVLLAERGWPTGPGTLRVARQADAVVVPSLAHAATVHKVLGVAEERVVVIPVGVDLSFYTPGERTYERRALGLDPGAVTMLFAGSLDDNKGAGLADVLRVMADPNVADAAGGPVELQVVGEGPKLPELMALAEEVGVAERVRWRGWVDREQLRSLMRAADVVVVPSRRESLGLVALEAAAVGTPVVATRAGGLPEHVVPGVTGQLYDSGDLIGLLLALTAVFEATHAGTLRPEVDATRFGLASTGVRLAQLTRRLIVGEPACEPEGEPAVAAGAPPAKVFDAVVEGIDDESAADSAWADDSELGVTADPTPDDEGEPR
jgi:glycosyltransferase involved in cell wall biosynthesis